MAKARCEWDALKFDPSTQKLHEFLDVLQKTAKEAFGSEAQQFIDKAIYAKMPDHVKKILNRAYLEDKPYNDIVLHLERERKTNKKEEETISPQRKRNNAVRILIKPYLLATNGSMACLSVSDSTTGRRPAISDRVLLVVGSATSSSPLLRTSN